MDSGVGSDAPFSQIGVSRILIMGHIVRGPLTKLIIFVFPKTKTKRFPKKRSWDFDIRSKLILGILF